MLIKFFVLCNQPQLLQLQQKKNIYVYMQLGCSGSMEFIDSDFNIDVNSVNVIGSGENV